MEFLNACEENDIDTINLLLIKIGIDYNYSEMKIKSPEGVKIVKIVKKCSC